MAKTNPKTQPQSTVALVKVRKESNAIVASANIMKVKTVEQEGDAYQILQKIKDRRKIIETERKKMKEPITAAGKAVDKFCKEADAPYKEADGILRDKILTFREEQEELAEKKREKQEKIQASHEARGHQTHDLVEVVPEVAAETVTVKRWVFDVVSESKVPRDYLMVDTQKIRQAVRDGIREIPGVEIYQEESLRV